jgi:hypothetical protein
LPHAPFPLLLALTLLLPACTAGQAGSPVGTMPSPLESTPVIASHAQPAVAVPVALSTPASVPMPELSPNAGPVAQAPPVMGGALNYNTILADGVSRQLVYPLQQQLLGPHLDALTPAAHTALDANLQAAGSETEQIFILKALAAGEAWSRVEPYAVTIRGLSDATLIGASTMPGAMDLVQQWQDSCGPAIVETAGGEYDPLYAYQLHALYQVSAIDPFGVNKNLAGQQKKWLEAFGGIAVPRNQTGGKAIAIDDLLNQQLTAITHATYAATDVSVDMKEALDSMAFYLQAGYAVPIRVVFVAENLGHFMVALAVRGDADQRAFLIHDSVTGKTVWVNQSDITAQNFTMFFQEQVALSHYYKPTPQ